MKIQIDIDRFKELRETHGFYTAKKIAQKEALLKVVEEARRIHSVPMLCDVLEMMIRGDND